MAMIELEDTYITLVDARLYADDMALDLPEDDIECEKLLKRASKLIDRLYGNRFLGFKYESSQPMAWPREVLNVMSYRGEHWNYTMDSDGNPRDFAANGGVPLEVGYATVEMAVKLLNDEDVQAQPEPMLTESIDKLDVLQVTRQYKGAYGTKPNYQIDLVLRPVLTSKQTLKMTRGA